jgi:hypothetical protein
MQREPERRNFIEAIEAADALSLAAVMSAAHVRTGTCR